MEYDPLYVVIYIFVCICIIFPPNEFIRAGITITNLCSIFIGSEYDLPHEHAGNGGLIFYHIRRTTFNLLLHSFLPAGFLFIKYLVSGNYTLFGSFQNLFSNESSILLKFYAALSIVLIILATIYSLYLWSFGSWKNHPAVKILSLYAESIEPTSGLPQSSSHSRQNYTWRHVARIIDNEFGSVDKFTSGAEGSGKQLIVTAHWLVKTSTYGIEIAHQSDLTLNLIASEEHAITPDRQLGGVQYVRIEVRVQSGRGAARVFHIRLNSLDFTALRDRLTSPINNARAVIVRSSVADRFVDVFLQQVDLNPPYVLPQNMEMDACLGCGAEPDVKLVRRCVEAQDLGSSDRAARAAEAAARVAAARARAQQLMGEVPGGVGALGPMGAVLGPRLGPGGGLGDGEREAGDSERCGHCFCRPMWCGLCMARWFAQRQLLAELPTESWLRGRAPCPTCRTPFCILDVSRISR